MIRVYVEFSAPRVHDHVDRVRSVTLPGVPSVGESLVVDGHEYVVGRVLWSADQHTVTIRVN